MTCNKALGSCLGAEEPGQPCLGKWPVVMWPSRLLQAALQACLTCLPRVLLDFQESEEIKGWGFEGAPPVRKDIAVQAPPPAEPRACPGRNASSAVPAPDALEKAATLS